MREPLSFERFCRLHYSHSALRLSLDLSRMHLGEAYLESMADRVQAALRAMESLEAGAIANADEGRRVGHYWLRAPERAPEPELTSAIRGTVNEVLAFASEVHAGQVRPVKGPRFDHLLVVGIGGSALGPQFVAEALGTEADRMQIHFLDNTDPDGMDRVLGHLGERLQATLTLVISKSGGTKETRNGMLEVAEAYRRAGLDFGRHAVAVTGEGSELDLVAREQGFLARFPMWDWVGGRTSELSVVGLLPAALQGFDIRGLLAGAAQMDEATRSKDLDQNPAALLALAWWSAAKGRGAKDMVLLPYKDRLALFSRYLQQLVMESLGKRLDRQGREVSQGLAVYGNKGSTDQHAYVQQLRDGLDNFFVTFLEVLQDRLPSKTTIEVEPGVCTGDYLQGFLQGTRAALSEAGRESLTITMDVVDARTVGALIALYERAVGLYAELADINAYHQPGVEAGKKAAKQVLDLQARVRAALRDGGQRSLSAEELAKELAVTDVEAVYLVLRHLAANPHQGVVRALEGEASPAAARFSLRRS